MKPDQPIHRLMLEALERSLQGQGDEEIEDLKLVSEALSWSPEQLDEVEKEIKRLLPFTPKCPEDWV